MYTLKKKKKENQYIFSSQLRADQMPGPSREGQLMCTLFRRIRRRIITSFSANLGLIRCLAPHGRAS